MIIVNIHPDTTAEKLAVIVVNTAVGDTYRLGFEADTHKVATVPDVLPAGAEPLDDNWDTMDMATAKHWAEVYLPIIQGSISPLRGGILMPDACPPDWQQEDPLVIEPHQGALRVWNSRLVDLKGVREDGTYTMVSFLVPGFAQLHGWLAQWFMPDQEVHVSAGTVEDLKTAAEAARSTRH